MNSFHHDPWLLTPGPLTTSPETKKAMLHDWGSRDSDFIETNQRIRNRLIKIAGGEETHVCVPLQGSGTFIVEATIATLLPHKGKALVLINGTYGKRMVKILQYLGREYETLETPEDTPPSLIDLDSKLSMDTKITHILAVQCETTSGILNPIEEIAGIVALHNRKLIIDAMSAFGAIPLSADSVKFDAIMASSNKCLEGVPGIAFAIIRKDILEQCNSNSHSLSLDLFDQWVAMENNSQWRFTPPTHVIMAFDAAIDQFEREGGVTGRNFRYSENCKTLVSGMANMGFETLLQENLQAPIIVTFKMPKDPKFDFNIFYNTLKNKGFIIYPGKLTITPSFRVGCIGNITKSEINKALIAVRETIAIMGVLNCSSKIL